MTREELEMRTLVRESDVIDRTDGSELAKAFNYLWEKYVEQEPRWIPISERMPNKDRYIDFYKCLVAVSCTSRNDICDSFTAYFDGKHFYRHLYDKAIISGVKAWMPMPTPYEPQEGVKNDI